MAPQLEFLPLRAVLSTYQGSAPTRLGSESHSGCVRPSTPSQNAVTPAMSVPFAIPSESGWCRSEGHAYRAPLAREVVRKLDHLSKRVRLFSLGEPSGEGLGGLRNRSRSCGSAIRRCPVKPRRWSRRPTVGSWAPRSISAIVAARQRARWASPRWENAVACRIDRSKRMRAHVGHSSSSPALYRSDPAASGEREAGLGGHKKGAIMTTTITDLDDFKALDPFFRIIVARRAWMAPVGP